MRDRKEEFIVIQDTATGGFFREERDVCGPGSYSIHEWVEDIFDATRYRIWPELDKIDYYEKHDVQGLIYPSRFKMPASAKSIRIRVTRTIEIVKK